MVEGRKSNLSTFQLPLPKALRFCYIFDMTNYEKVFDFAIENYGLITTDQARTIGVSPARLVDLAHRGRLVRIGHSVYQIVHYLPTPNDAYAQAVALIGHGAYLYGESVVALLGLAPTSPDRIYVAVFGRVRRNPGKGIVVCNANAADAPSLIEGIPAQSVWRALVSAKDTMPESRIEEAAAEARRQGRIDDGDMRRIFNGK